MKIYNSYGIATISVIFDIFSCISHFDILLVLHSCVLKFVDICSQAPPPFVFDFGKHSGSALVDVAAEDPYYLDWLAGRSLSSQNLYSFTLNLRRAKIPQYSQT